MDAAFLSVLAALAGSVAGGLIAGAHAEVSGGALFVTSGATTMEVPTYGVSSGIHAVGPDAGTGTEVMVPTLPPPARCRLDTDVRRF